MAEILNQFGYTEQKSSVKNGDKGHAFSCKLASAATPGTFVKIKSVAASKAIVVEAITADTDNVFGVIPYESARANSYVDGEMVTVMGDYTRIICEASAAIAAGATVMPVITGLKVATQTTGKTGIGIALTPAAADTNLIEVLIKRPLVVA